AVGADVVAVPGSRESDVCLVIPAGLWQAFRSLSLWIEALSIHEWCLFSERVRQERGNGIHRGEVYFLLTARPDDRRPLTWESNRVDLLMLEDVEFICPWTNKRLTRPEEYEIDHLLPLAV